MKTITIMITYALRPVISVILYVVAKNTANRDSKQKLN